MRNYTRTCVVSCKGTAYLARDEVYLDLCLARRCRRISFSMWSVMRVWGPESAVTLADTADLRSKQLGLRTTLRKYVAIAIDQLIDAR